MTLLKELTDTVGDVAIYRKLTTDELKGLGYEFTGRKISIGTNRNDGVIFAILEVCDEDLKTRKLPFCYLQSIRSKTGIILGNNYTHYAILA